MASRNRKNNISGKQVASFVLMGLFLLALPISLIALRENTNNSQEASGAFKNLNSGYLINKTNNADGTMGPLDHTGNFSNTLEEGDLGTLTFMITDPYQPHPNNGYNNGYYQSTPTPTYMPTEVPTDIPTDIPTDMPTESIPSPTSMYTSTPTPMYPTKYPGRGEPQDLASLTITISKVEVHLARLDEIAPKYKYPTSKKADHWETLDIGEPQTVDLVDLAKGNVSTLGITKLAAGRYTEVRLYISSASAVLKDGTPVTLTIPGRNNIVRIIHVFQVKAGENSDLTMDFDAQNSVIEANDIYILKPVVAKMINGGPSYPSVTQKPCMTPPLCMQTYPPTCKLTEPKYGWCKPEATPTPYGTCIPRPACLDGYPACKLPQPAEGWCSRKPKLTEEEMKRLINYLNNLLRKLKQVNY